MDTAAYGFSVAGLDRLRAAGKSTSSTLDDIWTNVNNDQFYDLRQYVADATGVPVSGYRSDESPGAFEAVMRTLDALERVVDRLNSSAELIAATRRLREGNPTDGDDDRITALIDEMIEGNPLGGDRDAQLWLRIRQQMVPFAMGLLDTPGPSHMIVFGPRSPDRRIELAWSGGGTRAATFALGSALFLLDAERFGQIEQISSVSGGSLTNGFLANSAANGPPTEEQLQPLAGRLVDRGAPLESMGKKLSGFVGITALSGIGTLVAVGFALRGSLTWLAPLFGAFMFLYLALTVALLFALATNQLVEVWIRRTINAGQPEFMIGPLDLLRRRRFKKRVRTAPELASKQLRDVASPVNHVFSATDLRHGEHIHFSTSWVVSETYDVSDPGDVRIDEAIRASAAFPGALPPVSIAIDRLSLPPALTVDQRHLRLADGGVRDNLGHVFQTRLLEGRTEQARHLTHYGRIASWIVVDASAPRGVADLSEGILQRLPGIRRLPQVTTFPRIVGIMNQSNSEARALALDRALRSDGSGFVVSIQDSPIDVCRRSIAHEDTVLSILSGGGASQQFEGAAQRSVDALRALVRNGGTEASWGGDVSRNGRTPTTLDGIGRDRVIGLIRHAYILCMTQATIEWGWDLLPDDRWSQLRFEEFVPTAAEPSTQ